MGIQIEHETQERIDSEKNPYTVLTTPPRVLFEAAMERVGVEWMHEDNGEQTGLSTQWPGFVARVWNPTHAGEVAYCRVELISDRWAIYTVTRSGRNNPADYIQMRAALQYRRYEGTRHVCWVSDLDLDAQKANLEHTTQILSCIIQAFIPKSLIPKSSKGPPVFSWPPAEQSNP